jgi:mannose-6-phosphate isomerase-like protein (cupin superfamily)
LGDHIANLVSLVGSRCHIAQGLWKAPVSEVSRYAALRNAPDFAPLRLGIKAAEADMGDQQGEDVKGNSKKGYRDNIEELTLNNTDFRRVLYTGEHIQLVLMTLQPGEEIGAEVHDDKDQFFRFESGTGEVLINDKSNPVEDGIAVIVPAGAKHNVRNTGDDLLTFYTLYGPPDHKDKTVHKDKAQAERDHDNDEYDGKPTE